MTKFLNDMLKNPDGNTYSTKRTAGWICLFIAIFICGCILFKISTVSEMLQLNVFYGFLGAFLGALGISSVDTYSFYSNKSKEITTNNSNNISK